MFTYRIYIPDKGRDDYGDVGLPTAEVVQAGGDAPVSPAVCNEVHKPTTPVINETLAQAPSVPEAEPEQTATGRNPPRWRKFVNVASAVGVAFTDNPTVNDFGQAELDQHGGRGGFLSNMDNAYVSALVHRGFGQVLVTRFRAPTFPDTRPGTKRMPAAQLRYWSICQNDPMTQRFVACINDDRAVIGRDGFATYVISPPNQRPANATRRVRRQLAAVGPERARRGDLPPHAPVGRLRAVDPGRDGRQGGRDHGRRLPGLEVLPRREVLRRVAVRQDLHTEVLREIACAHSRSPSCPPRCSLRHPAPPRRAPRCATSRSR